MRLATAAATSVSSLGSGGVGEGRGGGLTSSALNPVQLLAQPSASGNEQLRACRTNPSISPPTPASWSNQTPFLAPRISRARLPLPPQRSVLRVLSALLGGPSRASATAVASALRAARRSCIASSLRWLNELAARRSHPAR